MGRYTTEHFICDCCKVEKDHILIEDLDISTPESSYGNLSFCSIGCFLKYFNNMMKDEKIEVEIRGNDY